MQEISLNHVNIRCGQNNHCRLS